MTRKKSANLQQKTANQSARADIIQRKASARSENLTKFFTQAKWVGTDGGPEQYIANHDGITPDQYRYVVLIGTRYSDKSTGPSEWKEAEPAHDELWAKQIASDQPMVDPVLVLDLDTGAVLFESYAPELDEDDNVVEQSHPYLNFDETQVQNPPWRKEDE